MGLRLVFLGLIFSSSSFANYEVYFTETNSVNFARDSFYKEVRTQLNSDFEFKGQIDRDLLVQAHPPVQQDFKTPKVKIPQTIRRMIRPIQRDLEIKAKSKAIIVDCKPMTSKYVSNCGIYRYSRPKQKVDASSVRYFSVEVDHPQEWAKPLIQNFIAQTENEIERKEAKLMQDYISSLSQQDVEKEKANSLLSIGIKQRALEGLDLTGPYVEYAKGEKGFYSILGFGSYDTDNEVRINGLEFGARNLSAEVNKMRWEVTYRGHLDQLSVQGEQEGLFGLSIGLGVNASLNQETLLHLSYGLRRSTKISEANQELSSNFNEDLFTLNISRFF